MGPERSSSCHGCGVRLAAVLVGVVDVVGRRVVVLAWQAHPWPTPTDFPVGVGVAAVLPVVAVPAPSTGPDETVALLMMMTGFAVGVATAIDVRSRKKG